ncbi:hypothetical protein EVAR_46367_1 [Eumeta japonica]|uniref:Uncharacterized protein n=1 Tax=Eumeta variegata TaxID=151549 RepID=A0A4C1WW07_EUMVA|nr:hypothetical protein EVAR_46367_1 [Eumeta japonica]
MIEIANSRSDVLGGRSVRDILRRVLAKALCHISEPFDFGCEIVRRIGDNIPWPTDKMIGRWRLVGGCC